MGECPNPECHENVEGIRKALFGESGTSGIVGCLRDKMPKKWLWIAILVFGIPLLSVGVKLWADNASNDLKFAKVEEVKQHGSEIEVLKSKYDNVAVILQELKANQCEMRKDIKKLLSRENNGK